MPRPHPRGKRGPGIQCSCVRQYFKTKVVRPGYKAKSLHTVLCTCKHTCSSVLQTKGTPVRKYIIYCMYDGFMHYIFWVCGTTLHTVLCTCKHSSVVQTKGTPVRKYIVCMMVSCITFIGFVVLVFRERGKSLTSVPNKSWHIIIAVM